MDVIQATQELERMNFAEEIDRMIAEMQARTNSSPAQIICSQDTLNHLWEESGGVYASESDIENGTGYVARYHGTPIMVSPEIEDGKLYLIPEPREDRPIQYRFDSNSVTTEGMNDYWWMRSPFSYDGSFSRVGYASAEDITRNLQECRATVKRKRLKKQDDEQVNIDEDSFLDILKGGGSDAAT